MKTKKVLTANLKPGMVSCEAAYTSSNHLVIQSNTTLTPDIIDKLKYYAIRAVKVYIPDPEEESAGTPDNPPADSESVLNLEGLTYFERVQQSEQFKDFKESVTKSVENFREQLNDIVTKDNISAICDDMLHEVDVILSKSRNSLHLLDMLQCLRGFDDMTYMHSMNVALICSVIGSWSGLPKEEMKVLLLCGLLHDIGKLKIPPDIIQKPGKLTDAEFEQIRSHPMLGYEILRPKNLDNRIKLAALQHHEKFNGKGYPNFKKKGKSDVKMYFVKNNEKDCVCERHRIKIPTLGWVRLKEKGYIPITEDGFKHIDRENQSEIEQDESGIIIKNYYKSQKEMNSNDHFMYTSLNGSITNLKERLDNPAVNSIKKDKPKIKKLIPNDKN